MDDMSFMDFREECIQYGIEQDRKFLDEWCKEAGVKEPVGYKVSNRNNTFTVFTNRPGYLIGRGGELVDKYQKKLNEIRKYKNLTIQFIEMDNFANLQGCDNS